MKKLEKTQLLNKLKDLHIWATIYTIDKQWEKKRNNDHLIKQILKTIKTR